MKYGDLIQDLASRSHNWKFYDENFRFMSQSQSEAYPWGTVQWELWLRSQVTPQSSQSTPATSQPQGSKASKYNAISKGYCYRIIGDLLQSSLQPSSLLTYKRAWSLFYQFHGSIFPNTSSSFPVSPSVLALFSAYLYDKHYAFSTVNTYVSAIGYSHKLAGAEDPTKVFFILQMLKGYNKKGFRLDSRLPITLPILERVMSSAFRTTLSRYEAYLFRAMCAIAFFAFL
ncbi:unnamed protein product, partial [Porites evermanni]